MVTHYIRQVRVVLQARVSSSRLPAKVILPISGNLRLYELAAKRAGNTGNDLIIATSTDSTDDLLAQDATARGFKVKRGSLNNVLDRFGNATKDMANEDICVRLTCDNTFPDGAFIDRLVEEFETIDAVHLTSSKALPYGVSVEVFKVNTLRQAIAKATTEAQMEHVTKWIIDTLGSQVSKIAITGQDLSNLRTTVDTLDDYLTVAGFFFEKPDAINLDTLTLSSDFAEWTKMKSRTS